MNDISNHIARPRSRKTLQATAKIIREKFNIQPSERFPAVEFLEYALPRIIPGFNYLIDENKDMPPGIYAYYNPLTREMHISKSVYDRAYYLEPRDLFTVAHEIAHAILLEDEEIILARQEKAKPYMDPEWQANELAAELLAPMEEVKKITPREAMQRYCISYSVATIQQKK